MPRPQPSSLLLLLGDRMRGAVAATVVWCLVMATAASAQTSPDPCDPNVTTSVTRGSGALTKTMAEAMLVAHNAARALVSPSAVNMPMLVWNNEIADNALRYIRQCDPNWGIQLQHSAASNRSAVAGFVYLGENLVSGPELDVEGAEFTVALWVNEKLSFTYSGSCPGATLPCGSCLLGANECGHYTQVVWNTTVAVGCAAVACPNMANDTFYICQYGPGGNIRAKAPYEEGTRVSCSTPAPAPTSPIVGVSTTAKTPSSSTTALSSSSALGSITSSTTSSSSPIGTTTADPPGPPSGAAPESAPASKVGVIVGVIVGLVVLVAVGVGIGLFVMKRRKAATSCAEVATLPVMPGGPQAEELGEVNPPMWNQPRPTQPLEKAFGDVAPIAGRIPGVADDDEVDVDLPRRRHQSLPALPMNQAPPPPKPRVPRVEL